MSACSDRSDCPLPKQQFSAAATFGNKDVWAEQVLRDNSSISFRNGNTIIRRQTDVTSIIHKHQRIQTKKYKISNINSIQVLVNHERLIHMVELDWTDYERVVS